MFYKKVFALFLCLLLAGQIPAQTKTTEEPKKTEVPAEIKEKAVNLLNSLGRDAEQFFLPENRVKARMLVADLMWEQDEKQARALFQSAVADLNTMIGQLPALTAENSEELFAELNPIKDLRVELLMFLAARDPKLALEAMQATSAKNSEGENLFTEDQTLELSIAAEISDKDPKQAYELAKKNLENNLEYSLFSTAESIYEKDAELGARLTREILGKIRSKKITSPYDNASNSNMSTNRPTNSSSSGETQAIGMWQVQMFLETVKKLNRKALKDGKTAVLADGDIKELVELLAQKYLNQPYLNPYDVSKIMPDVNKYSPAMAQAIRRKLAATSGELDTQIRNQAVAEETSDKTADEILLLAEKKPIGERDDFYRQAAEKAFEEGDVAKAKEFYAKVKKKPEYDYFGDRIENDLPFSLAKNGDLRATREALAKVKTPEERIEILTNLAVSVAGKGDKKTAATLVDEARSMYAGRMKQRKNLSTVLQLGYAYSAVEPAQGFAMVETNMTFINDVIAAGILLDEFNDLGSVKNDEVRLSVIESESYRNLKNGVGLIKNLALTDFERLTNLADRFARHETRFFARFRVAQALLDPDAEATEKEMQSKSDERYYVD
jgi:Flp pilus assembly protein TadD